MRNIAFCAFGTDSISGDELEFMCRYIPQCRIEASKRYRSKADRNNCIASFFLLLYGLIMEYGLTHIPETILNSFGKPYFTGNTEVLFNLSHCNGAVCCALSPYEVGVDIQDEINDIESILKVAMSSQEQKTILAFDDPKALCTRYWSQKEAYLKYKSTGITDDICTYDFSAYIEEHFKFKDGFMTTKNHKGYSISVCCENGRAEIITNDISRYIRDFMKFAPH